ncbi:MULTISPECIES: autotransporter domain-containing protein [unclassified Pseudomonas]|uniref:autotransporter domain-containing protein n=1 Tax=unclassified Pseudomonas TaxID=196821 RepID=UPI000C86C9EF|nr:MULTISPECIES: autotransporter domain-containing protein [unclassified Pseudomonas]PMV96493.1 autotransporter domain-containing protein [Pseudomonas sp. GW460-C8]PMW23401.1 autotransporter domain-containing protein [Pseudomonas sp. GW456-E6]PMW24123.1 autotransporter domain-containing protein [Pseudomonas sp. GW456-11-11-14-TSB2]PMW40017.1 autotransporter domain-containing protein [Pseudomonas sp. GW460-7]PMW41128.1 autotransporter domain-containing protein [Pseudomonas sp. FW305-3-2-15-A-R2
MHDKNNRFNPRLSLLVAAIGLGLSTPSAQAANYGIDVFAPTLGTSINGYNSRLGGSGDGEMLVGGQTNSSTGITSAFQWTLLGGKQYLASLGNEATANAASNDGSVIVGSSLDSVSGKVIAVSWNSTGIHAMELLNNGFTSEALGVSADGSVIAGYANDGLTGNFTAVTWNSAGNLTNLGYLSDGTYSFALGVSADGHVVVGYAENGNMGGDMATRWINGASAESLGTLVGGISSRAKAASADGTYIVGFGDSSDSATEAFIWSQASGIKGLGMLSNGTLSAANGISSNGAVVVGVADTTGSVFTGFRWTAETGMQSLVQWLQDNDPSYALLPGNSLDTATAVSADGNTVFGMGTLNGRDQPFVARSYGPISVPAPVVTPPVVTPPVVTPPPSGSGGTTPPTSGSGNSTPPTSGAGGGTTGGSGTPTAGGSDTDTAYPVPPTGVIGLYDLGDSLNNASLYAEAMQNQLQGFVQDQLNCTTFDTKGICVNVSAQMTHHNGTVQGDNTYGGLTIAYRITPDLVAGIGYQGPSSSLKIHDDRVEGDTNTVGAFVEYGNRLKQGVFARGAVAISEGDATIKRSYLTGAGTSASKGKSDISQRAVSGQAGYVFIVKDNTAVMPYVGLDYLDTKLDGYTETSGPYPVQFDSRTQNNVYGTAGVTGSLNLGNKAILSANLKHVERLNNSNDDLSGEVLGVSTFDLKQDTTERWDEVGLGVQLAGPVKASRVGVSYGHRFNSDKAVASDVATVSFSVGF